MALPQHLESQVEAVADALMAETAEAQAQRMRKNARHFLASLHAAGVQFKED